MFGVTVLRFSVARLVSFIVDRLSVFLISNMENLVLWARSEIIGSALINEKTINPKHEIRNPKQYIMTKILIIQTMGKPGNRL
jgi:hypothetical protein